jgi:hypothetical protein
MRAGLRRLIAVWSVFGVLATADAVAITRASQASPLGGLLGRAALGVLILASLESYLGPWARGRQAIPDAEKAEQARLNAEKAARVMAAAVGEQLRSETDKDGQRVRRCS